MVLGLCEGLVVRRPAASIVIHGSEFRIFVEHESSESPPNVFAAPPQAPLRRSSGAAACWPAYPTSIRSAQISIVSPDCISIQNRLPSSPHELMDADGPHGASWGITTREQPTARSLRIDPRSAPKR